MALTILMVCWIPLGILSMIAIVFIEIECGEKGEITLSDLLENTLGAALLGPIATLFTIGMALTFITNKIYDRTKNTVLYKSKTTISEEEFEELKEEYWLRRLNQ